MSLIKMAVLSQSNNPLATVLSLDIYLVSVEISTIIGRPLGLDR